MDRFRRRAAILGVAMAMKKTSRGERAQNVAVSLETGVHFGDDDGFKRRAYARMIDDQSHDNAWYLRALKEMHAIGKSIVDDDKRHLLHGMLLTRATDNALKRLFLSGDMVYLGKGFQGKGFRSLGQEAIFGATLKLATGSSWNIDGRYVGDVAAPLIRDLGVFLAMSDGDVATAINAQAGKSGKPCDGRDLHLGDLCKGIVIPAAPLAIATSTLLGMALSFKLKKEMRVALSFIGEGGSSLGEWHEAINCAAVFGLPMVFCIENNQTALSTPRALQCRARRFADKAIGYGMHGLTIDGNDVEAVACAFKFASDEARAGRGPILIELMTMRMCGHAHHDDMLYLGKDPTLGFTIEGAQGGYVDKELFEQWRSADPIKRYQAKLLDEGVIDHDHIARTEKNVQKRVDDAVSEIIARPWPVFAKPDHELVMSAPWVFAKKRPEQIASYRFDEHGVTYMQAIAEGIERSFSKYPLCMLIGEDVAPPYGNAFMMFRAMKKEYADRFINTPIAENAIVGACVGMALSGMRPIGEMQFNDFAACAMDQIVNNAAKHFFRTGQCLPMVLRMPYGGLRRAGPFHSQDTSPWFYQTPGLKIMAPSTPIDAMHMLMRAVDDDDPVLFYEHIALYRDPVIKQDLAIAKPDVDGAALVARGDDITLVTYGAFLYKVMSASYRLSNEYDKSADVIDLRYLSPIDFDAIYASVKKTSRLMLIGEDKRTGGILDMVASKLGQELFQYLDAPITVVGARDTPVPYAPSLEDAYLVSVQHIVDEALRIIEY
jgi:2-oxoisovalerate dehydrogenase E1 component